MVELFLQQIGKLSAAAAAARKDGSSLDSVVHAFANHELDDKYHIPSFALCRHSSKAHAVKFSLKLVSNPYARAVSSYFHQMHTNITGRCHPQRRSNKRFEPSPLCKALRIKGKDDLMGDVSFVDWLEAVKHVGFADLDIHTWPQSKDEHHGGCGYSMLCKLEEVEDCLGRANAASGANFSMPALAEFRAKHDDLGSAEHHAPKLLNVAKHDDDDVATWPYARLRRLLGEPVPADFYSPQTAAGQRATALVRELYKADFASYNYSLDVPDHQFMAPPVPAVDLHREAHGADFPEGKLAELRALADLAHLKDLG